MRARGSDWSRVAATAAPMYMMAISAKGMMFTVIFLLLSSNGSIGEESQTRSRPRPIFGETGAGPAVTVLHEEGRCIVPCP